MKRLNLLLSAFLLLFPKSLLYSNPYSNLLDYVRQDLANNILIFLPQRIKSNLLELCSKLSKLEKTYELNKAETAYSIFTWIQRNIYYECSQSQEYNKTPDIIFKAGKGTPNEISFLFKTMCNHLEIEAGIIPGYIKFYKNIETNREWNYIKFNNTYYLIDVSMGVCIYDEEVELSYYDYFYFGAKPEMLIRSHFPKEIKWQLLNNPISLKQFLSMASLTHWFYIYGFKTVSPDSFLINDKFINFNLTFDGTFIYKYIECVYSDFFGKENTIKCKYNLISDKTMNFIINSISEKMNYISIYVGGYNPTIYYNTYICRILSFKIDLKNDDYSLSKDNNYFENHITFK